MSDTTLETLVAVSRKRPKPRELCCPKCGGPVRLHGGRYHCIQGIMSDFVGCEFGTTSFGALAELAVKA